METSSNCCGMDLPSSFPAEDTTRAMSTVTTTCFGKSRSHQIKKTRTYDWFSDLPISASTWAVDQFASLATDRSGDLGGRLLVGISQDRQRRQTWIKGTISLWQKRFDRNFEKNLHPPQFCNGKEIARELRKARASGSLEAFRKSLTLNLLPPLPTPSKKHQKCFPHCVLIDRIDTAGTREDDLLLLCQLIDALLNRTTLLVATLPGYPNTLGLHPAFESRLESGLIIPLGHGESKSVHRTNGTQRHIHQAPSNLESQNKKLPQQRIRNPKKTPTIRRIISIVSRYCGIDAEDIIGTSQRRCHVRPRGLVIHCAHILTDKSSHAIGKAIGGRDHTTVLHSLKVTTSLIQHDPGYAGDLAAIIEQLTKQTRSP